MKHLLIDFESVQPADLNGLDTRNVCVWLLLGTQQQDSLPLNLCESLCRFNGQVNFIRLQDSEAAAYIGFRLGAIVADNPAAQVAVLSQNAVYDVLAGHIRQNAPTAHINRVTAVADLPDAFRVTAMAAWDNGNTEETALPAAPAPVQDAETAAPQAVAEADAVLEKYYPVIVQAMSQKDAYHPRHRRNLAANIERYLSQYSEEIGAGSTEMLAELVIVRLDADGLIKELGDGLLSYHFEAASE